jgi:hypothetical protein
VTRPGAGLPSGWRCGDDQDHSPTAPRPTP